MSAELTIPSNYYNKTIQMYEKAIESLLIGIDSIKSTQVNHPENDYTEVINQCYNKINQYYELMFKLKVLTK